MICSGYRATRLNVFVDFARHPITHFYRSINLTRLGLCYDMYLGVHLYHVSVAFRSRASSHAMFLGLACTRPFHRRAPRGVPPPSIWGRLRLPSCGDLWHPSSVSRALTSLRDHPAPTVPGQHQPSRQSAVASVCLCAPRLRGCFGGSVDTRADKNLYICDSIFSVGRWRLSHPGLHQPNT